MMPCRIYKLDLKSKSNLINKINLHYSFVVKKKVKTAHANTFFAFQTQIK